MDCVFLVVYDSKNFIKKNFKTGSTVTFKIFFFEKYFF